jgi:hypothetical protein
MSDDLTTKLQELDAAVDDDEAALNAALDAQRLNLHTSMPGTVTSYDPGTQTVQVQPGIQRLFRGQGAVDLPKLVDVPVFFPRGGGFVLSFPVQAGDECLLVFSERAIDFWWKNGGSQLPSELRTHDLSDAFAFVGFSSNPGVAKVSPGLDPSAVELRSLDGQAKIQIDGSQNITVQSNTGDITASSATGTGMIKLNAQPGATSLLNGVLLGAHPCPILGTTHGSFGGGVSPALRVLAGST